MTATATVICDRCHKDLTYTSNSEDYRVVLRSEGKTPWFVREGLSGGVMTDMGIPNPVPRAMHFCNLRCLHLWSQIQRAE